MSSVRYKRGPPPKFSTCEGNLLTTMQSTPRDLPPPTLEDLDFDDPPSFLASQIERLFWCLSARVRKIIMEKYPRKVFFCFYRGVCTFACEDNHTVAKNRIKVHHERYPHHFIGPHWLHLKPWMEEVERRKKIRNEIRRGRRRDDVRDVDIRPKYRFNGRPGPLKGITYHYPDTTEGLGESYRDTKHSHRDKEDRMEVKVKSEIKVKSEVHSVKQNNKLKEEEEKEEKLEAIEKVSESKLEIERSITKIDEVNTKNGLKEIYIREDKKPKDTVKEESKESEANDALSADEDETIESLFKEEFCEPKVQKKGKLTKLIRQRLKLKQKRPRIVIGPIKGRKLRLNEKKFKVKKSPFAPIETKAKMENDITENENKVEETEKGDKNAVEIGTCKYCEECIALKDMKEHYLTHLDGEHKNTKPIKVEDDDENKTKHNNAQQIAVPAVQENCISSTENIQSTTEEESKKEAAEKNELLPKEEDEKLKCEADEISKEEIEEKVRQKFDAYAKEPPDPDICSKFIKRWGNILDIDDVSQYNQFDSTKFNMFFECINDYKQTNMVKHKDTEKNDMVLRDDAANTEMNITAPDNTSSSNIENSKNKAELERHTNSQKEKISKEESPRPSVDPKLRNIILNPRSLTGDQLIPGKVLWCLPDKEIVSQNRNMKKGSKMSLDECCNKFTNRKITVENPKKRAANSWGEEEKILEVAVNPWEKVETDVPESRIILNEEPDTTEIGKRALESETVDDEASLKKVVKAEKDTMTDQIVQKYKEQNKDEMTMWNHHRQTKLMPHEIMTKVYYHNLADIKIEIGDTSNNQNEETGESQPAELVREIKTEYLNSDQQSEEYFEDLPSESDMEIKDENNTIISRKIIEENSSTPESRLAQLINVRMGELQVITMEMIAEVFSEKHLQKKRKQGENKRNEKRRKLTACSEDISKNDFGSITNKTFPSVENLLNFQSINATEAYTGDADASTVVVDVDNAEGADTEEINPAGEGGLVEDNVTAVAVTDDIIENAETILDEAVTHIKEEPCEELESNPNDPLSVMFVMWKDDNDIDMIEDDLTYKEDIDEVSGQSSVKQTTYKPVIPRLKLNIPQARYKHYYSCHRGEPTIRFKKFPPKDETERMEDPGPGIRNSRLESGTKNPSMTQVREGEGRHREVKTRQCKPVQSVQGRKIENLHLVRRRGVFTISSNEKTGDQARKNNKSSKTGDAKTEAQKVKDVICVQLLPGGDDCDRCPACKVALSPMSLDWVLNTKTGKVVFTCPQCDQPVSVEGSWSSLVRQYTNSTDDKPNKIS